MLGGRNGLPQRPEDAPLVDARADVALGGGGHSCVERGRALETGGIERRLEDEPEAPRPQALAQPADDERPGALGENSRARGEAGLAAEEVDRDAMAVDIAVRRIGPDRAVGNPVPEFSQSRQPPVGRIAGN